jgi:hypothetical protein
MNITEEKALLAKFTDQRDAFASKLKAALEAAGFEITGILFQTWTDGVWNIKSPVAPKDWQMQAIFKITSTGYSRLPSGLQLRFGVKQGWRFEGPVYKLDDALIQKLVVVAQAKRQEAIDGEIRRNNHEADQARWLKVRKMELMGLVVPPAVRINIVTGNGPDAGKYAVKFDGTGGILSAYLSKEQVFKLSGVINEILGVQTAYVIVVEVQNRKSVWAGGYWNSERPQLFPSYEAADTEMGHAKALAEPEAKMRIVSYASYAVI